MDAKALQDVFLSEVEKLKLRFPGADIAKKTGYKPSTISEYLNGKKGISEDFLRTFCKSYGLEFEELFRDDKIKKARTKERDKGKAITKEMIEEQLRIQEQSSTITLYDEFTLRIIGTTLSTAFMEENLGSLAHNIGEKVRFCRLYAREYYSQRLSES